MQCNWMSKALPGMLIAGCVPLPAVPIEDQCVTNCGSSKLVSKQPAAPLQTSAHVPPRVSIAVTFAEGGENPDLTAMAKHLLITLHDEGRLLTIPPILRADDLTTCLSQG